MRCHGSRAGVLTAHPSPFLQEKARVSQGGSLGNLGPSDGILAAVANYTIGADAAAWE